MTVGGERTVYVKVGIKHEQALLGLRQLKSSLDGIAQQDLGKPRNGLAGIGKVNASGLRGVRSAMDGIAAQDFRRPQSGLDGLFTKANLFGGGLALGVGKAVSAFADFDQQMSAVSAATGLAGDGLSSLREAAITAGADTQYSATEAASAITELSKAGVSATDVLGGGLTGALNLAAAGQMGVADAAETMATSLAQFKLHGDQASHVADLLAAGAGKAQGSVSDMGQALKQAGLVADGTGLSIEETVAGLTAFANAGLIGSDAGTSFKSMLQRLTPTSAEAAGMMQDLNISAYDAQGNFVGLEKYAGILRAGLEKLTPEQRNAAMATIFGSDAVRAANVLYEQGATGIAKWTSEISQQGYASKQAAALTDNLRGDLERLGGAVETSLIKGGSGANDALRSLTKTTEGLVVGLSQIPAPLALGATALAGIAILGPKIGKSAEAVTGPLKDGMQRFRDEMALHQALATQVVGGYRRLGDETLVASGKVGKSAVAMSAARSTIGGLKGAAGGLLGVLGGPWGLALAGATAAIGVWAQKQADAKAAADALNGTVDAQTDKFTSASKETVLSGFAQALSPEDVKAIQTLGVNLNEASDAALQGGPALEAFKQKMRDLQASKGGLFTNSDQRLIEAFLNELDKQGDAADRVRASLELLRIEKNRQIVADSRQAGSAASAERNMSDLGTTTGNTAGAMKDGAGAVDGMGSSLKDVTKDAKDAKTEMQNLLNLVDSMAGGKRALQADKAALKDAGDAAVKAAKYRGGYDPAAVKAVEDAKAELAKARSGGGGSGKSTRASADGIAKAELSLKQARDHLALVQGNSKSSASALESARNRVESATLRLSQAQGRASATGGKGDAAAQADKVKRAEEVLANANKRLADSFVAPEKAQADYEESMRKTADQGDKLIHDLMEQKRPISEINKAYEDQRAALIKAAEARGYHGDAAQKEADKVGITVQQMDDLRFQYAHTQEFVDTQVRTPGLPKAKTDMEGYWEVINGVPTFKPTTPTTPGLPKAKADAQGYWEVLNGIPRFIPTEISIGASFTTGASDIISSIGGIGKLTVAAQKKAIGGPIHGIGTGTSDSNLVLASKGEHMLTAAEVKAAGGHAAIYALRKAILSGGIAFRAQGGPIAATYRAAPVSVTGGSSIDYDRLGRAVAAQMPPQVSVYSGHDARTAARSAIRDWEWGQVQ